MNAVRRRRTKQGPPLGARWLQRFCAAGARILRACRKRSRRPHDVSTDAPLPASPPASVGGCLDVLDEFLAELQASDHVGADIVAMKLLEVVEDEQNPGTMRGLSTDEVAERLGISVQLAERRWSFLKAGLIRRIEHDCAAAPPRRVSP